MDNPDLKSPAPGDLNQLEAELQSLRQLIISVLVLMIIISGTLSIYLLRQWRMTSKDLASIRPAASQVFAEYTKERAPRMDAFLERLKDYGRTHSDFVPILIRYQLVSNTSPAVGVSPSTPAKK